MLKVSPEVSANIECYRTGGNTATDYFPNCSIGRRAFPGNLERSKIITRLLCYLRSETNFLSILGGNVSFEELRLHVTQCVIEKCLKHELVSQGDEASYFSQNIMDFAVTSSVMASLTCNDASEVMVGL